MGLLIINPNLTDLKKNRLLTTNPQCMTGTTIIPQLINYGFDDSTSEMILKHTEKNCNTHMNFHNWVDDSISKH